MDTAHSKPIICGTDYSENAREAAHVAVALAQKLGAPLILVHAEGLLLEEETSKGGKAPAVLSRRLREEADRLRALGATVEEVLLQGAPDEVLSQLARDRDAGLLVVSSLGLRAPTRWLLGSVAERTAETSPVPTLVVRDARPFEAWARGERPLRVFVGADFSTSSDAALRWISQLRQIGPCDVVAGYVDWPPEETARLRGSALPGIGLKKPGAPDVMERDIATKVKRALGSDEVKVRVVANWGRPDAPLIEMAIEAEADLIAVGAHQWNGLHRLQHGSVSRAILHFAPMTVACVPADSAGVALPGPRIRECQRVLVAVDLGESHGFAAPYGYSIVKPGGAVRLMHNLAPFMLPNPMIGGSYRESPTEKDHARLVTESAEQLLALAPPDESARGIKTTVEVTEHRDSAAAICEAAERFGADIICIGSHTRPGFTAKVLGSISLAVLQNSRRPVLVVWPPAD